MATTQLLDPFGEPWHPADRESPHSFDYKFSICDPSKQAELRAAIDQELDRPGSVAFSLKWFHDRGEYRRFTDGQAKQGCFVQAGAVITDGFGTGRLTKLLATYRSETQFHNSDDRHKPGDACVFATALASCERQDPHGHVPTALFNDINEHCPWALFSRKLLLPDIHMDSRFLGIAYNFERTDKSFVFLLWHVRTEQTPKAMRVAAREFKEHDIPYWCRINHVAQLNLTNKPIDRFAITRVLRLEDDSQSTPKVGFVDTVKFEKLWRSEWSPEPVNRDEIVLDLLRMYQMEFHVGRRRLSETAIGTEKKERGLQKDLKTYLEDTLHRLRIRNEVQAEVPAGIERGAGRLDLRVTILDTDGHYLFRYVVELKLSGKAETAEEYITQCQRYAASQSTPLKIDRQDKGFDAIVLLHGITGEQNPYPLQGAITHASRDLPLHVVRIALEPIAPSDKGSRGRRRADIAHGLIVVPNEEGVPMYLVFTQQESDECPRLPGGKVKKSESPEEALVRELREELNLGPREIRETQALFPGRLGEQPGKSVTEMSVGDGIHKDYRFHPFVVFLTPGGRKAVEESIGKPNHFPRLGAIADWFEHGNGAGLAYPQLLRPILTPELLARAVTGID